MKIIDGVLIELDKDEKKLSKIIIPKGVTSIGEYAFYDCRSLTSITIPKSVISIGDRAFSGCRSLTSITIPKRVSSIGKSAFCDCRSLTSITIPESVISIGDSAFYGCRSLTSITIPKSVTIIGESAFCDCSSLISITIPESVISIGEFAFFDCSSLINIIIPESVTIIGASAFRDCSSLTSIIISESVTSIGDYAFNGCSSLTSIIISESVTSIGDYAFNGCSSLTKITFYPIINLVQQTLGSRNDKLINSLSKMFLVYSVSIDEIKLNLEKYKYIYDNVRFYPNISVVEKMTLDQAKKFKLEPWRILATYPLFAKNDETKNALVEFIAIMGLFENDYQTRLNYIMDKFLNYNIHISILDQSVRLLPGYYILCDSLMRSEKILFDSCYQETFESIFLLKIDINEIEEKYKEIYITNINPRLEKGYLTEREYQELKEISLLYKEFLNKYFDEHIVSAHKLKTDISEKEKQEINVILFKIDRDNLLTYSSIHRMFDGCNQVYDPDCYDFIMRNIEVILSTKKNQSMLSAVVNSFSEINNYYSNHGNKNFDYYTALMYLERYKFENVIEDNEEFAYSVGKAGVREQDKFEAYQDINEVTRKRIESAIPRYDNIFIVTVNDREYKIRCKILHQKSYLNSLIGEVEYSGCCQCVKREGENCMIHASNSEHGGIFATYLIDEQGTEQMLTQSWVWVRNGLLCFDDIEATQSLRGSNDTERQRNRQLALYGYKMSSKGLIEASSEQIEDYIKRHPQLSEEEIKKLRSGRIIKVTVGNSIYNKVDISSIIEGDETTPLQPLNYNGYSDSKRQCVIEGIDEVIDINTPTPIIYRDDREIVKKVGSDIKGEAVRRIKEMEKEIYPEAMQIYNGAICDSLDEEAKNLTVLVGEDWYMIYAEDNNSIRIHDMAKTTPRFEDEAGVQASELSNAYKNIIENSNGKIIEADLRETTSYVLYLFYLTHGIIEQVGEDNEFIFGEENNMTSIESIKQNEILNNKEIRRDNIMHRVKFRYKQNDIGPNSIRM